jgi:ABC-type glycerol-3-phosphate transport system permease component
LFSIYQEGKALENIGLNRLQPQGASASSLAILPVFLVFLFFQRRIVEGGVLTGLTG